MSEKKKKVLNILMWIALGVLVATVIVTSIILHQKQKKLDDLKSKNEIVKPESSTTIQENKIFLKNFEFFIDIELNF